MIIIAITNTTIKYKMWTKEDGDDLGVKAI